MKILPEWERQVGADARLRSWVHATPEPLAAPSNAHTAVEVSWVQEGEVRIRSAREELVARPGTAMLIPARREHATSFAGRVRAGALWVQEEIIGEVAGVIGRSTFAPATVDDGGRIAALARILQDELMHQEPGAALAAAALIEAILVRILRATPAPRRPTGPLHQGIRAAIDLCETRYPDDLSLDELSAAAGLSRWHFGRVFREQVGRSPYRYLTDVRIDRAAEMLRSGHGVTRTALDVGFRDLGRFSRAFQARHGVVPSRFAGRFRRLPSGAPSAPHGASLRGEPRPPTPRELAPAE